MIVSHSCKVYIWWFIKQSNHWCNTVNKIKPKDKKKKKSDQKIIKRNEQVILFLISYDIIYFLKCLTVNMGLELRFSSHMIQNGLHPRYHIHVGLFGLSVCNFEQYNYCALDFWLRIYQT